MNYLYIPTSTLNFNNIFSTESVSPVCFYSKRGFGYSRYELVDPNPMQNITLLYDKYPIFSIDDDGRDHYPMVIKIKKDLIAEGKLTAHPKCDGVSIFSFRDTIYFKPDCVEIFFRNEVELNTVLIKAEPSLTTKMVPWYKEKMFVFERSDQVEFEWNVDCIPNTGNDTSADIEGFLHKDRRIDRLKGLFYGYLLGRYKSIPKSEVELAHMVNKFKNYSSSLINANHTVPDAFIKIVNEEFDNFVSSCKARCKEVTVTTPFHCNFIANSNMEVQHLLPNNDPQFMKNDEPFVCFVNRFCLGHNFTSLLTDNRIEVGKRGGEAIKGIIGSRWEGSSHKKYTNELLNNVKSGKPFIFKSIESPTMKAFAAFILKGDDLAKLEAYLLDQRVGDFGLAFALWGGMFGFSKIPKTSFDILLKSESRYEPTTLFNTSPGSDGPSAMSAYNYIYNELHGRKKSQLPRVEYTPIDPVDKNFDAMSNALRGKFPGIDLWLPKVEKLFSSYGRTLKLAAEFKKMRVKNDLGGQISGSSKKNVDDFLREYCSKSESLFDQSYPSENSKMNFWEDGNAWDVISDLIPPVKRPGIERDLEWFKAQWNDPQGLYGSQNVKAKSIASKLPIEERTNNLAIESFCRLGPVVEKLNLDEINKVRETLLRKYLD